LIVLDSLNFTLKLLNLVLFIFDRVYKHLNLLETSLRVAFFNFQLKIHLSLVIHLIPSFILGLNFIFKLVAFLSRSLNFGLQVTNFLLEIAWIIVGWDILGNVNFVLQRIWFIFEFFEFFLSGSQLLDAYLHFFILLFNFLFHWLKIVLELHLKVCLFSLNFAKCWL
jgi:hypothetical protein